MVFHKHPQPTTQSSQPYIDKLWKKMKLQHKYNKVLFVPLEKTLSNDFFKGKIHMNPSKDPPFDEFNKFSNRGFQVQLTDNHCGFPGCFRVGFVSFLGEICLCSLLFYLKNVQECSSFMILLWVDMVPEYGGSMHNQRWSTHTSVCSIVGLQDQNLWRTWCLEESVPSQ